MHFFSVFSAVLLSRSGVFRTIWLILLTLFGDWGGSKINCFDHLRWSFEAIIRGDHSNRSKLSAWHFELEMKRLSRLWPELQSTTATPLDRFTLIPARATSCDCSSTKVQLPMQCHVDFAGKLIYRRWSLNLSIIQSWIVDESDRDQWQIAHFSVISIQMAQWIVFSSRMLPIALSVNRLRFVIMMSANWGGN